MIPIRNFPYTDYHDLNLDWLLRQMQIWDIDLEALKRRVKVLEDWRADEVDPDLINIKGDIVDIKIDITDLGNKIRLVNNWMLDLIKDLVIRPERAYDPNKVVTINGFGSLTFDKVVEPLKDKAYVSPINASGSYTASKVLMYENYKYRSVTYNYDDQNKVVSFIADYGDYYKTVTLTKTGDSSGDFTVSVTTEAKVESNVIHLESIHTTTDVIHANLQTNSDPATSTDFKYYWEVNFADVTSTCMVNATFDTLEHDLKLADNFSDFIETFNGKIRFYIKYLFQEFTEFYIHLYMVK